jgi:putative peptidoglycan lipid II flippase
MSRLTGGDEAVHAALRDRQRAGLRRIAFLIVPSLVAFVVLGDQVIDTLYRTGRFQHDEMLGTWGILGGASLALLTSAQGRLIVSGLWALGNTRTPFRITMVRVTVSALLGCVAIFLLRPLLALTEMQSAAAMMTASSIGGWLEFALLRRALVERIGPFSLEMRWTMRFFGAALVGAAAGRGVAAVTPAHWPALISGPLALGAFGGVYLTTAWIMRAPEAEAMLRTLARRLPGRRRGRRE